MKELITKHKFLTIALLFLVLVIFVVAIIQTQETAEDSSSPTPTPQTPPGSPIPITGLLKPDSAVPGKTSLSQTIELLGEPAKTEGDVYYYNSNHPRRQNQVVFRNQTLAFFKEIITSNQERRYDQLTLQYGLPELILYGEDSTNGINLHAYPSQGVAILANPNSGGIVWEVWYFEPTDSTSFKNKWAREYFDTEEEAFSKSTHGF